MISARLKKETKISHQRLEKIIVTEIRQVFDASRYQRLLNMFWGFHWPMEHSLKPFLENPLIGKYLAMRKADCLLEDIGRLENSEKNFTLCNHLPAIDNLEQALGVLYVLLGSTLGGRVIAAMLQKQAPIPKEAMSFFLGKEEQTQENWDSFTQSLDFYGNQNGFGEKMILAAEHTFRAFEDWAIDFYNVRRLEISADAR